MYFQNFDQQPMSSNKSKKIILCRNGDFTQKTDFQLTSTTTMNDIKKHVERKFDKSFLKIRLFTSEGVELGEEDIEFIKNSATIYVSRGEDFDANTSFNEYEIVKELGEGGFGKVVLGQHKLSGEKVAIKIIKTAMLGNAQDIDMVFRESEMLKSLSHKNIVKVFRCFTLSNMQVVFIMEYLEGGELMQLIQDKGRFPEQEAQEFFKQIVSAIAYCHQNRVIHRDLKLENLLLTNKETNQIKLIDFGISGLDNNFNPDNPDIGSVGYMAPELFSGSVNSVTPLVDVWAMGVILYAILFGKLPFHQDNTSDLVEAIKKGEYEIPSDIQPPLSGQCLDCLKLMLQVNPENRISAVDLQYHPWLIEKNLKLNHQNSQEVEEQKVQEELKEKPPLNLKKPAHQKQQNSSSTINVKPIIPDSKIPLLKMHQKYKSPNLYPGVNNGKNNATKPPSTQQEQNSRKSTINIKK